MLGLSETLNLSAKGDRYGYGDTDGVTVLLLKLLVVVVVNKAQLLGPESITPELNVRSSYKPSGGIDLKMRSKYGLSALVASWISS